MRLIVISDSHGKQGAIDRVLSKESEAAHIFFLGDKVNDIEDFPALYPEKQFHIVSGNCDYFSDYKVFDTVSIGGLKILFCHGHTFYVKKGGNEFLADFARKNGCQIALYGHTHIPDTEYADGLYIVNPGSIGRSREGAESYAAIDILENGILPQIIRI